MAGEVSQDQCETRRLHCGEAMARTLEKQEAAFNGFLGRLEQKIDPLVTESAKTGERCKSNTHRLNWAWGILASLIVGVLLLAASAIAAAL